MSKKSRKNSSKAAAGKAALAGSRTTASKAASGSARSAVKKTAKKPAAKTLTKAPAKKAVKKAVKKPAKPATPAKGTATKVAPEPTLKPAKFERRAKSAPAPAAAKAVAAKAPKPPAAPKAARQPATVDTAPATAIEGGRAPAFDLQRDGGARVSLADFAGQKLVIFFYPRADTPGCTKEAIDFTRLAEAFAESGAAVVGISADPLKAQEMFRDKRDLTIPLLSDESHKTIEAYGAWGEKSMYGRTFQGVLRTTVLIDAKGRIARIWRSVKVDGHADEVLAATRNI